MTVKELKDILATIKKEDTKIMVACDEEWNTLFQDIRIEGDAVNDAFIIFGLSGSEVEQ